MTYAAPSFAFSSMPRTAVTCVKPFAPSSSADFFSISTSAGGFPPAPAAVAGEPRSFAAVPEASFACRSWTVSTFAAVTGVINTLQYFTQAAVAASVAYGQATTGGGISSTFGYPEGSTFTYPLWLYVVGFRYDLLGYANAMAVVLFVVAFAVTVVMLRRSRELLGSTR